MTNERIRSLIRDNFAIVPEWNDLPDDLMLVENYVLDSLDMMSLVALVDAEFGISIPDEDIVLANFGSIARIAAYLDGRQQPPEGGSGAGGVGGERLPVDLTG